MDLEKVRKEIRMLAKQLSDDDTGTAHSDARENTFRSDILERIAALRNIETMLLKAAEIPYIPGAWNVGDYVEIEYTKIVAYGVDRELPPPFVGQLVAVTDIDKLDIGASLVAITISSDVGREILNCANDEFTAPTNVGYVKFKVKPGRPPKEEKAEVLANEN